ncbi:MAG: hypothetical protein KC800_21770 [Candidatus Eremiobacteraeota bacterium]|nr:hypothetical protein [Candidatus Eremiobacteraeota bacterium]
MIDTGSITLNTVKAREKLSKFSFPEPGLWVVKILQAAVACGAPEIRFEFLRRKVNIRFANAAGWNADQILNLLTSGQLSSDRALMHLQVGLSGATCAQSEAVAWSCGGKTVRLLPDSAEAVEDDNLDDVVVTAHRVYRGMSLAKRFTSPIRHQFHQTAHEYKALVDRVTVSPIPVFLDSFPLPRRYARNDSELPKIKGYDSEKSTGGKLLAVRALHDIPERKELRYPIVDRIWLSGPEPGIGETDFQTQWWKPEERSTQAVLSLFTAFQKESEVLYVLDGARLTEFQLFELEDTDYSRRLRHILEEGEERFNLSLVLEVSPEQVDLSHFQVRTESLMPVLMQVVPALVGMMESVHNWCVLKWKFGALPTVQAKLKDYSLADFTLLGLGIAMIPLLLGLVGLVVVLSPLAYFFDPEKTLSTDLRARLDPALEKLRDLENDQADYF